MQEKLPNNQLRENVSPEFTKYFFSFFSIADANIADLRCEKVSRLDVQSGRRIPTDIKLQRKPLYSVYEDCVNLRKSLTSSAEPMKIGHLS